MDDLRTTMLARQPQRITALLHTACVGIAGAGGLGSVVAENLARAGVGRLIIADFDVIEPSNLNRQRYSVAQLGQPKAETLAGNLGAFNPFIKVEPVAIRLTFQNCGSIFADCAIIAECLDNAADKAAIVSGILKHLPGARVVAASGIAGLADADQILTRKISHRLFVVGDMQSDSDQGTGLFASRVGVAASKQAHAVLRLLTGELS